jgi:thymidylate synthase ThyX
MEVIVAGVNVDRSLIDKVRRGESVDDEAWTPETLSASYARISRSPLAITELREQARAEIERARKSNETIVFGMGHNSIAEHAVFNFDILDVSRLLVEEIERFRLCSFTEKSQRYVLFSGT